MVVDMSLFCIKYNTQSIRESKSHKAVCVGMDLKHPWFPP